MAGNFSSESEKKKHSKDTSGDEILEGIGSFILKTALLSGAILKGAPAIMSAVGFGEKGPKKDSSAAAYQSKNFGGSTPKDHIFGDAQRFGQKGFDDSAAAGIILGSAAIVGAYELSKCLQKK